MSARTLTPRKKKLPKLLACGWLPPPISGPSIFFAYLTEGLRASGTWRMDIVNTGVANWQPRQFTPRRILHALWAELVVLAHLPGADLLYLSVRQSTIGFAQDALLIWAAKLLGKRVVVRNEGGAFHILYQAHGAVFQWLIRKTVQRMDRVQVISETIRRQCAVVPGLADRMEVIIDGVDSPELVTPKQLPREGPLRVLFLSNMVLEKGYADLLEAVALLRARHPALPIHLDFAGDFFTDPDHFPSPYAAREDFWKRVASHQLREATTYHGVVAGERKDHLFREAHVFALPTYYRYEGSPRSVREALAFALPVIVTDWSGLPEMVTDGENGLLVPVRDAQALARALESVLLAPERYAALSRGALERARRDFSRQAHIARTDESFRAALPGRTPTRAGVDAPRLKP